MQTCQRMYSSFTHHTSFCPPYKKILHHYWLYHFKGQLILSSNSKPESCPFTMTTNSNGKLLFFKRSVWILQSTLYVMKSPSHSSVTTLTLSWNVNVRIILARYKQTIRCNEWFTIQNLYKSELFRKRLSVSGTEASGLSNFVLSIDCKCKVLYFSEYIGNKIDLFANGGIVLKDLYCFGAQFSHKVK